LVTGVLQRGGSNIKASNSIKFIVGKYTLDAVRLNKIIRSVVRNGTNRQFARSVQDKIASVALHYEPGDLSAQMKRDFPSSTIQELV